MVGGFVMNLFIKEQDLDNSVLEQLLSRKAFEEKFIEIIMRLLENESSLFLFAFKRELEIHNQLKDIETLYEFVQEIKDIYTKCVDIFNKNLDRILLPEIREIIGGIINALKTELLSFSKDADNLITYERITMISGPITLMKEIIRDSMSAYLNDHLSTEFVEMDMRGMIETLINHVLNGNMESLKELHSNSMKELNQFDKRLHARRYMGYISSTKKSMGAFISIQPDNFKEQMNDESEIEVLKDILLVMQGIYKKVEIKEQEMYQVVNQKNFSMETIHGSFKALMVYNPIIDRMVENEELLECFNNFEINRLEILNRLKVSITDEIKKTVMFSMLEITDASKEFQLLSCQTVERLKVAQQQLHSRQLKDLELPEESKKIVLAMSETLQMKYETLKEKEYEYIVAKKENSVAYEKQLFDFSKKIQSKIDEYFEVMLKCDKYPFVGAHESYKKLFEQLLGHNLKFDLSYLKTDLLFEIVTLEEIVKYSSPKLTQGDHKVLLEVIEIIRECYDKISRNITKAGIEPIEPQVHDKFNGKEHEVIMTEEVEGFIQGEVITVHTKGYKFEGLPILRASVTAAK